MCRWDGVGVLVPKIFSTPILERPSYRPPHLSSNPLTQEAIRLNSIPINNHIHQHKASPILVQDPMVAGHPRIVRHSMGVKDNRVGNKAHSTSNPNGGEGVRMDHKDGLHVRLRMTDAIAKESERMVAGTVTTEMTATIVITATEMMGETAGAAETAATITIETTVTIVTATETDAAIELQTTVNKNKPFNDFGTGGRLTSQKRKFLPPLSFSSLYKQGCYMKTKRVTSNSTVEVCHQRRCHLNRHDEQLRHCNHNTHITVRSSSHTSCHTHKGKNC